MTDPVVNSVDQAAQSVATAIVAERRSVVSKVVGWVAANPKTVLAWAVAASAVAVWAVL